MTKPPWFSGSAKQKEKKQKRKTRVCIQLNTRLEETAQVCGRRDIMICVERRVNTPAAAYRPSLYHSNQNLASSCSETRQGFRHKEAIGEHVRNKLFLEGGKCRLLENESGWGSRVRAQSSSEEGSRQTEGFGAVSCLGVLLTATHSPPSRFWISSDPLPPLKPVLCVSKAKEMALSQENQLQSSTSFSVGQKAELLQTGPGLQDQCGEVQTSQNGVGTAKQLASLYDKTNKLFMWGLLSYHKG